MKLKEYIKTNKIKQYKFAEMINASPANLSRWVNEKHIPSVLYMMKILKETGGQVSPADFYNIERQNETI